MRPISSSDSSIMPESFIKLAPTLRIGSISPSVRLPLPGAFSLQLSVHVPQLTSSFHASFSCCSRSHRLCLKYCDYMLYCIAMNIFRPTLFLACFECTRCNGNLNDHMSMTTMSFCSAVRHEKAPMLYITLMQSSAHTQPHL
jgi:hypothetical protein